MLRRILATTTKGGLVLGAAALIASCGSAGSTARHAQLLSPYRCGGRWSVPADGQARIAVKSDFGDTQVAEVYLANARTGALYNVLDGLARGDTRWLTATLGSGEYELQCFVDENAPVIGPRVRIVSSAPAGTLTPGVLPLTFQDLVGPTKAYQAWVVSRLPVLLRQVQRLRTAVAAGPTAAARAAWLTAHLTYERLGAAYDAFGPLDQSINGFPANSGGWRADHHLTGFHLIEGLLWSGAPATKLEPAVTQLEGFVRALIKQFATTEIDLYEVPLRSHEIVENAVQFELTGATDEGSHTNLATISANLWGARNALRFVAGLLKTRYPQLGETEQALAATRKLVAGYDRAGTWEPLQSLTARQREQLNASMENLVELLAPIPTITEIRNTPTAGVQTTSTGEGK